MTDQDILASLVRLFEPQLEDIEQRVVGFLVESGFRSSSATDFVYRHSLPYLACSDALNCGPAQGDAVVGCVLSYSFPLMGLDILLDGGAPVLRRAEELWGTASVAATALLTNLGYALVAPSGVDSVSLLSSLARRTINAMMRDSQASFDPAQLNTAVDEYWRSGTSRLFGSAINELMFGVACQDARRSFSPHRRFVAAGIGRLRQAADELMDVREDVRRGLVTLPVLCALSTTSHAGRVTSMVREIWDRGGEEDADLEGELTELVLDSSAPEHVLGRMRDLRDECLRSAKLAFPDPEPVELLIEQRWLQGTRAVAHGLCDPPPYLTSLALAADRSFGVPTEVEDRMRANLSRRSPGWPAQAEAGTAS
ncbi:hypothetical protein DKT68_14520 [Micromonospora acroterricola]|uniref:Polyprenyl synthetase n=1 Tax=Micromonospora acroterricola TaxID=2202421 RepID=A0A317D503_9ACTN|nr:hypothetical protein DKT68_14520 [Micromonospora acroterricola]